MATVWKVSDSIKNSSLAADISCLESCFSFIGEPVSKDRISEVTVHRDSNGREVFIKRYTGAGRYLRRYFGRSRIRAEWENMQLFASWGIPTPEILACGEQHQSGKFVRGALVTAGLVAAKNLEELAGSQSSILFSKEKFQCLARQVASYASLMHGNRFAHNDLDWRNILVAPVDVAGDVSSIKVYFFDCPGGRRWVWPFLEYRIIKDLAHLDKIARHCLPSRWRLWFYYQYAGRNYLTAADKRRIRKIITYYDKK